MDQEKIEKETQFLQGLKDSLDQQAPRVYRSALKKVELLQFLLSKAQPCVLYLNNF